MLNFPNVTTAREIQRNYRRLFDYVKNSKKPLIVMRNNKPEVAIIDVKKLEELEAIATVFRSWREARTGKTKVLSSLVELWNEATKAKRD